MKTVKLEKLSKTAFAPFGEYYNMDKPEGYALKGELHAFYPDRLSAYQGHLVSFSPITVNKPEKMIITQAEYHTTTCEIILPLNDDMVLHVAPPSAGKPVTDLTKAFIVPKHTLIKMNPCVWHLAPLPLKKDSLTAMIVLPNSTYMNDCKVVDFSKEDCFEIVK